MELRLVSGSGINGALPQPISSYVRGTHGRSKDWRHRAGLMHQTQAGFRPVPYSGWDIQFLILLPDKVDDLAALEARLTANLLAECANLREQEVILLAQVQDEPPVFPLGKELRALGVKSAFDQPGGSANFERIAPRRANDYLCISEVFHKTFLKLDEKVPEAAAATAVQFDLRDPREKPKPIEARVDHPFLFAIQRRPSGACLFLGRIVDPR